MLLDNLLLKVTNCGCKEWPIFKKDLLRRVPPENAHELMHIHSCERLTIYQPKQSLQRIYVFKEIKKESEPKPDSSGDSHEPTQP